MDKFRLGLSCPEAQTVRSPVLSQLITPQREATEVNCRESLVANQKCDFMRDGCTLTVHEPKCWLPEVVVVVLFGFCFVFF